MLPRDGARRDLRSQPRRMSTVPGKVNSSSEAKHHHSVTWREIQGLHKLYGFKSLRATGTYNYVYCINNMFELVPSAALAGSSRGLPVRQEP
jgi:hypothetical protein